MQPFWEIIFFARFSNDGISSVSCLGFSGAVVIESEAGRRREERSSNPMIIATNCAAGRERKRPCTSVTSATPAVADELSPDRRRSAFRRRIGSRHFSAVVNRGTKVERSNENGCLSLCVFADGGEEGKGVREYAYLRILSNASFCES